MQKEPETPPVIAAPTVKEVAQSSRSINRNGLTGYCPTLAACARNLSRRVHNAAHKLGYQPNPAARNLRVRSTRTIGMVFPDIENPFYASVISGAEDVLQNAGYSLLAG